MLRTLFTFILALQSNLSLSKTISKDQIACTMCDSCNDPCQPLPSPPAAPPEMICPPPPSPQAPPVLPECPPPPAPPNCSTCIPSPEVPQLPPPKMPWRFPPPFPPSTDNFEPPVRVPYFSNDYNPSLSSATSIFRVPRVTSVFVFLGLLCCF